MSGLKKNSLTVGLAVVVAVSVIATLFVLYG